jgi:hypothetical protein
MKKLKVFLMFVSFLLLTGVIFAEKVLTFPELMRPFFIRVDDSQMYVTDGPTISIYSLSDYKLLKQFGREGEGPGEFKIPGRTGGSVAIFLTQDNIVVNSVGKVSYFTKKGEYVGEIPTRSASTRFLSLGKQQFVGEAFIEENDKNYSTRNIYNDKFEKIKELYRRKSFMQPEWEKSLNPFYTISPVTHIYDKKIFISSETDEIYIFNENGEKINSIKIGYEKLPVNETYKKGFLNFYKTDLYLKDFYESVKDRLKFPKYFPAIRLYDVVDDKIYVLTYKKEGEKSEFLIYDIKGKFLNKVMVPLAERDDLLWSPYTIKNGKLYQLIENQLNWELHVTEIK